MVNGQGKCKWIYGVIGVEVGAVEQNALRLVQFGDAAREPYRLIVLLCK